LLKIFNERKIRYLIVGGYAVMKYTEPRFTKDLDVWIEASPENAQRVFNALVEFGAPLHGLTEKDFEQEGSFYQMGRPPARIDILMSIDGVSFADAWQNRFGADLDGVPAMFISRQDLLVNKKATGRLQDQIDAENLVLAEEITKKLKQD